MRIRQQQREQQAAKLRRQAAEGQEAEVARPGRMKEAVRRLWEKLVSQVSALPNAVSEHLGELRSVFEATHERVALKSWYWAIVVALLASTMNIALVVTLDNTNVGTSNGLWKTPEVYAWEHGTGDNRGIDSGGILYARIYGSLAALIPDAAMQFGGPSPVVTFRKMAVLNSLFGGLASGWIFLLSLRFSRSMMAACLTALLHACAGFVLLNSVNSEDIMPAYALFVGAVFCIFEFLHSPRFSLLCAGTILFSLAVLMHWTLLIPALAGFGAVSAILTSKKWTYAIWSAAWLGAWILSIKILLRLLIPSETFKIASVLFPSKANTGFVGFHMDKIKYLFAGIGNYLCGGQNVTDFTFFATYSPHFHLVLAISWIYLILGFGFCVATLISKTSPLAVKLIAAFAVVVFAIGEAANLYSQPQDPQMQLQPMLAGSIGFMLALRRLPALARPLHTSAVGACVIAALAVGAWNVYILRAHAGNDRIGIQQVAELERLLPSDRTVYVSQGYESWLSWEFVLSFKGDWPKFRDVQLDLIRPFVRQRSISGEAAAVDVRARIDAALASGKRVVACALWTQTPDQFAASLSTLTDQDHLREYDRRLRTVYRLGKEWKTSSLRFVELLPLPAK
jgi:hypothetical protein